MPARKQQRVRESRSASDRIRCATALPPICWKRGGARRPSRSVPPRRPPAHLSNPLPNPPLPEVPNQRAGEVAVCTPARAFAGVLFPLGIQRAPLSGAADLAEQEASLQPAV